MSTRYAFQHMITRNSIVVNVEHTWGVQYMTERTFKRYDALAKYRVSMKRKLRVIGCQFDSSETTEHLEKMMQINNLEV